MLGVVIPPHLRLVLIIVVLIVVVLIVVVLIIVLVVIQKLEAAAEPAVHAHVSRWTRPVGLASAVDLLLTDERESPAS